jgi:hypothetical protein
LKEIENLKKFKALECLNLCSTYYPLELIKTLDENQEAVITGSREIELVFFSLRNNLTSLHIGNYADDEIIIYIAEMCKNLVELEINSEKVNDSSIVEVLRKL